MPVAALVPGFGGAIAPIGPSLIVGAFVFGIGMQLANGCGSGTLYTVGGGSGRMIVTLAFFIAGSVIGSLHLPAFLRLGGVDPILAANYLGPWGGLAATWASLARRGVRGVAIARRRGAHVRAVAHEIVIGARRDRLALDRGVCRRPPSLERDLRFHGVGREDRARSRASDFSQAEFWQWAGPKRALGDSILSDTSSLTDFGMILGAMAAAAASAPFARNPGRR